MDGNWNHLVIRFRKQTSNLKKSLYSIYQQQPMSNEQDERLLSSVEGQFPFFCLALYCFVLLFNNIDFLLFSI